MKKQNRILPAVLVGLVYGLYFSLGFAYFETFRFSKAAGMSWYLPLYLILSIQGTWMAAIYFRRKPGTPKLKTISAMAARMLLVLLVTGALLYLHTGFTTAEGFSFSLLQHLTRDLLLLSMLPLVVALLLWQQRSVRVAMHVPALSPTPPGAGEESHDPAPTLQAQVPAAVLRVDAGGDDHTFEVLLSDLILVEAADNYCKFYFLFEGRKKIRTLRMKLKSVEEALEGNADFFRVHRSFIVNRQMVEEVQGPSQAHKLRMQHHEELVPVSRSFDIQTFKS